MKRLLIFLFSAAVTLTASASRVDTVVIHSDVMNRDIPVVVIVPTACADGCKNYVYRLDETVDMNKKKKHKVKVKGQSPTVVTDKRFPVVYMLHGAYGNHKSWLEIKPDLPRLADEKQMIFVTPYALNSWYIDSPKMPDFQYETFMTEKLISYVDKNYPTIASRKGRAITGLSMGGHGALFLAMRHKDLYGAAGAMSGGVDIRPFPLNWNLPDVLGEMAANKHEWDSHTVVNQIDRINDGDLWITFDCGEDDFFLEVNKDLHKRLLGRGIKHDFTTRPGGHTSEYWANSIDYHLLFFGKFFAMNNETCRAFGETL